MLPKGHSVLCIVLGVIGLGLLMLTYHGLALDVVENKNVIENGWYYSGTSVVTEEQFNEIKKYDKRGAFVTVTELNPLKIEYRFGSIEDYSFLEREEYNISIKFAFGFGEVILIVCFAFPIMYIASGFVELFRGE